LRKGAAAVTIENNSVRVLTLSAGVLLAAVMVMLAIAAVEPAHAAFPGSNGHIAFTSDRTGNFEIFQMDSDGDNPVDLTLTPATDDHRASYSANGKKIVFDGGDGGNKQEIYSMNANGLLQTRLTRNSIFDVEPVYSPDGKKIAFSSNRITSSQEIFVMNADGTRVKILTDAPAASFDPAWSPDGKRIAFTSNRDGNIEVYRMNVADTNHDGQGDNPRNLSDISGQDSDPFYSPDGTRIAFQTNRDGNAEIYVMNATTGISQVNLTQNAATDFEASWQALR
jgi:Tol biopolymer transport system component